MRKRTKMKKKISKDKQTFTLRYKVGDHVSDGEMLGRIIELKKGFMRVKIIKGKEKKHE